MKRDTHGKLPFLSSFNGAKKAFEAESCWLQDISQDPLSGRGKTCEEGQHCISTISTCYGLSFVPQNSYVGVLTPRASACDLTWRWGLYGANSVKIGSLCGPPIHSNMIVSLQKGDIWRQTGTQGGGRDQGNASTSQGMKQIVSKPQKAVRGTRSSLPPSCRRSQAPNTLVTDFQPPEL